MDFTAQKGVATGEEDQQPSSNSGPMLYHRVSTKQATDPGRDPSSPTTVQQLLKTCLTFTDNFHLRLMDSCNMLAAAEPATIAPHTVPVLGAIECRSQV